MVTRYRDLRPIQWGTDVAGVRTRLPVTGRMAALTFDACGSLLGKGYDGKLIDFLRRSSVPATLFLNARWIDANPDTAADLAADPLFEIGNHGTLHLPLSVSGRSAYGIAGTRSVEEVFDEVDGSLPMLADLTGKPPVLFRSGTAHYDEIGTRIVGDLGMRAIGFDVNGDGGATFTANQVQQAMCEVRPGSIVIAHLNHPGSGTAEGMIKAIPELVAKGFRFVHIND